MGMGKVLELWADFLISTGGKGLTGVSREDGVEIVKASTEIEMGHPDRMETLLKISDIMYDMESISTVPKLLVTIGVYEDNLDTRRIRSMILKEMMESCEGCSDAETIYEAILGVTEKFAANWEDFSKIFSIASKSSIRLPYYAIDVEEMLKLCEA